MDAPGQTSSPPDGSPPPLQSLVRAAEHGQNVCVLAILTWIASCDGSIADDELELLRGVAAGVTGGETLPAVIDVARLGRADDLEFACRYVRNKTDRSDKLLLARLLVTMAAQDGHITVAENHVLRFMADLLGVSPRRLAKLFEELTHRPFPEVGDVSSVEWWLKREAGEQAAAPRVGWGLDGNATPGGGGNSARSSMSSTAGTIPSTEKRGPMTYEKALILFGLTAGASADEVHSAYRRLAKARHPDRFAALGPAAQATATAAFRRVQEAYELLSSRTTPAHVQ